MPMPSARLDPDAIAIMDLSDIHKVLCRDDGSLPDVDIDFSGAPVAAKAYALVQGRAVQAESRMKQYWSRKARARECVR